MEQLEGRLGGLIDGCTNRVDRWMSETMDVMVDLGMDEWIDG